MATITENINALKQAKTDIHDAIVAKGQDLTNVPFTQYAEKITAIQSGGGGGDEEAYALIKAFITRKSLDEITPEMIDKYGLSNITIGTNAFNNTTLKKFISRRDQRISGSSSAFSTATSLIEARVSMAQGEGSVFLNCSKLEKLVLYEQCDFTGWGQFNGCSALKLIDLRTFTKVPSVGTTQFSQVADGCEMIIPHDLYDVWRTQTNWVANTKLVFVDASTRPVQKEEEQ